MNTTCSPHNLPTRNHRRRHTTSHRRDRSILLGTTSIILGLFLHSPSACEAYIHRTYNRPIIPATRFSSSTEKASGRYGTFVPQVFSSSLCSSSSSSDTKKSTSTVVNGDSTKDGDHTLTLGHESSTLNGSKEVTTTSSSTPTTAKQIQPPNIYKEAIQRTLFWVGAATFFGVGLWYFVGIKTAEEFFAGYLVEQSLSVDNLFVFLMLFDYFKVPHPSTDGSQAQRRVLDWGIFGAIIMRALMIGLGSAALHEFHAIILVFASILVYSSLNVLVPMVMGKEEEEEEEDMSDNAIVKLSGQLFDSVNYFDGDKFWTEVKDEWGNVVRKATPLFICMVAVEVSDVVFAVDSIPAVFGVTENPLVVFSSNIFAIMGLRSLYTILSKAASDLEYLEPAVAIVLGFIGNKMIAEFFGYTIPTTLALTVVASVLTCGVGLSVWSRSLKEEEEKNQNVEGA